MMIEMKLMEHEDERIRTQSPHNSSEYPCKHA